VIDVNSLKKGMVLLIDGRLYSVVDYDHMKMGRGGAVMRTKLKDLTTNLIKEITFRSGEKLEEAEVEWKHAQYLYNDGANYYFMLIDNYEQISLSEDEIRDNKYYLLDNLEVDISLYKGKPISLRLPTTVNLKIVETPPNFKGDTVSASLKPAMLETGLNTKVPMFIKKGDIIKVDTRDGSYVARV